MLAHVVFMLVQVGLCWDHVASCWLHAGFMCHVSGRVCPKTLPSGSKLVEVGLQTAKMGLKSLQESPRASKMSHDGLNMAPKSIFLMSILLILYDFHKYWKSCSRCSQGHFYNILHPSKIQVWAYFWNKFWLILGSVALCAPRCLLIASRLFQVGLLDLF